MDLIQSIGNEDKLICTNEPNNLKCSESLAEFGSTERTEEIHNTVRNKQFS